MMRMMSHSFIGAALFTIFHWSLINLSGFLVLKKFLFRRKEALQMNLLQSYTEQLHYWRVELSLMIKLQPDLIQFWHF